MSSFDGQTIEIVNWEKYNPKRDQKTYTWLRLDNGVSTDPDLFGLDAEQKYVWIEILCQASKRNSPFVKINLGYIEHITGVKKNKIALLIEFLLEKPMIRLHDKVRPRAAADCSDPPPSTTPTYERTNETNVTNVYADSDVGEPVRLDFEIIYQEYPRKDGKQEGLRVCKARIKSQEDFDQLLSAVRRYRAQCEREGTEKQYIKHFSSFMNKDRWKDWLDPEAGTGISTTPGSHIDWSKFT